MECVSRLDLQRGPHEPLGVVLARSVHDLVGVAGLDHLAAAHDDDAVAERADDLQIVADEEVGEAAPPLQVAQQVDDLPLHGKIERRGRLVEQDEFRVEHQRAGDRDALALAAGEFVREAVERVRVEPDIDERCRGRARRARAPLPPMPLTISPSSMICFTDSRGLSEEKGSWKTTCICGRNGRISAFDFASRRSPFQSIVPPSLWSSRRMALPSVVLPEPDSPTMPSVSPLRSARLTSSTATSSRVWRLNMPPQRRWYSTRSLSVSSTISLSGATGFGRPDGCEASSFFV